MKKNTSVHFVYWFLMMLLAAGIGWAAQVPTTLNSLLIPGNLDEASFPATGITTRGAMLFGTDAGVLYVSPGDGGGWTALGSAGVGCGTGSTGPCTVGENGFVTDGGLYMYRWGNANETFQITDSQGHVGTGLQWENGSVDWFFQKLGGGTSQSMTLQNSSNPYYTWSTTGDYAVSGTIAATGIISSSVASGSNGLAVTANGARIDFGAGASDFASSDGTIVTFAGPMHCASTRTVGTIVMSGGTGTATVNSGALCVCSVDTAFLACQPSVSGTTLTVTVTAGGSNTVSYICL